VDGPTGLRRRRVSLNQAQAKSLRAKNWAAIDVANLAEEIDSVGREQAHASVGHQSHMNLYSSVSNAVQHRSPEKL
jgi:Domain of unknown function DUF29